MDRGESVAYNTGLGICTRTWQMLARKRVTISLPSFDFRFSGLGSIGEGRQSCGSALSSHQVVQSASGGFGLLLNVCGNVGTFLSPDH